MNDEKQKTLMGVLTTLLVQHLVPKKMQTAALVIGQWFAFHITDCSNVDPFTFEIEPIYRSPLGMFRWPKWTREPSVK